jgi:hypothetical protein
MVVSAVPVATVERAAKVGKGHSAASVQLEGLVAQAVPASPPSALVPMVAPEQPAEPEASVVREAAAAMVAMAAPVAI